MNQSSKNPGETFKKQSWESIKEPGAYVCNDTGHLLRVPTTALDKNNRPTIEFAGPQGSVNVTRLSNDPRSPIEGLRTKCTAANIKAKF